MSLEANRPVNSQGWRVEKDGTLVMDAGEFISRVSANEERRRPASKSVAEQLGMKPIAITKTGVIRLG